MFDMDMSTGDFLALFYLLKVPVETINLKVMKSSFLPCPKYISCKCAYLKMNVICCFLFDFIPGNTSNSNRVGKCSNNRCYL